MATFDPKAFGPAFAELLHEKRIAPLGPGQPHEPARHLLSGLTVEKAFAGPVIDRAMAECCLAGIWLYHDCLTESHTISQSIETPSGSYWHGLMHRREPDYANAKYWFRQVGRHPALDALAHAAEEIAGGATHPAAAFLKSGGPWDPFAFIDLCEASASGRVPCEELCRQIQQREWEILFDYCYGHALGAAKR